MRLVLDSNEYIFAFGSTQRPACSVLIDTILSTHPNYSLRIPRLIVEEVGRHLTPEAFKEFMGLINSLTAIDENFVVPFELGARYEARGLKPADAFIAAYVEWTGAEVLVSENRHFLRHTSSLSFQILNADNCIKLLKAK